MRFVDSGRCWIDLDAYDALIAEARQQDAQGAWHDTAGLLEQAAALYRGDLLEEDRYEDWPAVERERRRELQIEVLEWLAALHARGHDHRRAIDFLQQVLSLDRLRESAYRELMRSALARGDRPAALRAFQTCERLLREELGVAPQPDTVVLSQQARMSAPA